MKNISFLIGSGFSVPEGFPTTSQINEKLKSIDASNICIHTSGDVWFLNGSTDPNADWMRVEERKFIQEFLEYYNQNILKSDEEFHYETFYDYYREFLSNDKYPEDLSSFLKNFLGKYNIRTDQHYLLIKFNLTFNQLIGNLLTKAFDRCHLCKPYHPNYNAFLSLIEILANNYIVNLHSLNHDLYIEYLSYSDSIQTKLDDGFEELNSPYYGKLYAPYERYMVRLKRFTNKFIQPFRLFKLHGSIDYYWFKDKEGMQLIKTKRGIGKTDVYKEVKHNDTFKYDNNPLDYYPDFLSGTTFKIRQYSKGDYFPLIFEHFERNLKSSNCLIVIGYGFGDKEINNYIKTHFLTNSDNKIFIVDINQPNTDFLETQNVFYVSGGMVGMDHEYILNNIS